MQKKIGLSLLLSSILVAQTIELEPLIITSTAIKTDELRSTDAVEVYTAEDIQNAHVQNIYEFLNQQTSVITMSSGNPFSQKLDLRGYGIGDGYQNIVVTLNGRKINNIDMVEPLLSSISPASIERLEIIKSSGIVVGGDGANAGVINITTKRSSSKEITIYGGTDGVADGSFYLGHNDDKLSISASGEAQKSDGTRNINSQGDKDESSLTTGTLNIAYIPIDALELRAGVSFARTAVIYGGYLTLDEYNDDPSQVGASGSATEQEFDTDAVNGGLSYYFDNQLSLNIDISREEKKSNYITYSSISDYVYNSARTTFEYESKNMMIVAGIDAFDGERTAYANETGKENLAAFFMSNLEFDNHSIKAGYRYETISYDYKDSTKSLKDEHSLYGAELGYNYTFDKEKSIFINYAHAYQAPDIDRFFDYGGAFNGFINPMKTDSFTLGFNYIRPNNKLKISIFYVDLEDEIYYYSDPTYINSKNTNIDKSHKYGLDIYDKWLMTDKFNVVLNYNYIQAKIDEEIDSGEDFSGNDLPGVSDHNIKATINYLPSKNITLAVTQVYRSEAYAASDFNNNFAQKQEAYESTDISISYTKDNLELFAKINNLFNRKNGLWIEDDAIYPINFTTTAVAGFKLKL